MTGLIITTYLLLITIFAIKKQQIRIIDKLKETSAAAYYEH